MKRSTILAAVTTLVTAFAAVAAAEEAKMVVIGDSTVQTYEADREVRGWGQYIDEYFDNELETVNLAMSGRSTKTFIEEGRWERARAQKGDYILIQFGHNDSHAPERPESTDAATDYSDNLRRYVREARADGAVPVLITPMHRRLFKEGIVTQELKPYADAMKAVAGEMQTPLIDLHAMTGALLSGRGDNAAEEIYVSAKDRTHFGERGARLMAWLVADGVRRNVPGLAAHLKPGAGKVYRHVVLFGFKEDATIAQIGDVEEAFEELPDKIPSILSFEWGTNVSPENAARGYSHCYFLTFLNEAGRDIYLPHPDHKAFGKTLRTCMSQVLVIDYWTPMETFNF